MKRALQWGPSAVLVAGLAVPGCGTARPAVEAAVPAEPQFEAARLPASVGGVDTPRVGFTEADVRFMQGMIGHHAQALVMVELVPARTQRADMKLLAERIDVSQKDEIAFMQRWLRKHGETAPEPDVHAHHGAQGALMPGMLTHEELMQLESATGPAFDRLFLELMIKHHEGALVMVQQLFATPRGGQEPELFTFAADVDADQNSEIRRMRGLLAQMPGGARP